MRVLVAPDCFTGTLSAPEAAAAIAAGWARSAPHDEVVRLPLSDGGPGFIDVLSASLGGRIEAVSVADPLGRPTDASLLFVEAAGRRTAYLESASAAGLHLLAPAERDPSRTSTYGVGQLLARAVEEGAPPASRPGAADVVGGGRGAGLAVGAGEPGEEPPGVQDVLLRPHGLQHVRRQQRPDLGAAAVVQSGR